MEPGVQSEQSDGSVTTTGLDLTCCYGIAFDPFDKSHLIISYIDIGLFHRLMAESRGVIWSRHPSTWVNTCYSIRFDPTVKGRVWSTWATSIHCHALLSLPMACSPAIAVGSPFLTMEDGRGKRAPTGCLKIPFPPIC